MFDMSVTKYKIRKDVFLIHSGQIQPLLRHDQEPLYEEGEGIIKFSAPQTDEETIGGSLHL